ncbi:magnesium/cobalt transporter CorA [Anthocerotibacter panamensis]|uniref:magnesium/cobalt transporter CorA n=1 Tax=Anthocerotibacter panamensis TaxID=2857077 RepID=UPI001C404808|nr:magnesium/cobalt transporter CorA [Anthocerotibacter panamensis]
MTEPALSPIPPLDLTDAEETQKSYIDFYYDEPGSMPGTLAIPEHAHPSVLRLIDYRVDSVQETRLNAPEACTQFLDTESVTWVDVQGLGSEEILQRLGQVFGLHPLVLEDVVNVPQRPKVEEYDEHLLIIARMVFPGTQGAGFTSEQVSFILGKRYLLTVQEEPELDCFEHVRKRIRASKGCIRREQADYLMYSLLDAIIDGFFPVLEDYGERLEALEDEVVERPTRQTLEKIHAIRRELLALRRAVWPQRDALNALIRDANHLVSREVRVYLRDCYDHAVQVLDMVETYRELASSLMEVYLSSVSNRMNEVMKFLTVVSSIFIPLTFIAGVYGMNFNPDKSPWNMPELDWYWGYPLALLLMAVVAAGLTTYFWRKGWFEHSSSPDKP